MSVRAKFRVKSVLHEDSGVTTTTLLPVVTGSEENKQFWKYTPSGEIKLSTVNTEAARQFEPGKELYVDFTPAD